MGDAFCRAGLNFALIYLIRSNVCIWKKCQNGKKDLLKPLFTMLALVYGKLLYLFTVISMGKKNNQFLKAILLLDFSSKYIHFFRANI